MYAFTGFENILVPIVIFICFYNLPLNRLSDNTKYTIRIMTGNNQGIYCLHKIINDYLKFIVNKRGTFLICMTIYLLSFIISFFFNENIWEDKIQISFCLNIILNYFIIKCFFE